MRLSASTPWAAVVLALAAAACGDSGEAGGPRFTWKEHVGAALAQRCVRCHADDEPGGAYVLNDYAATLDGGSDELPNALAGDPDSLLLTILDDPAHTALVTDGPTTAPAWLPALRAMLTRWVVDDELAYFRSLFHPPDWVAPQAAGFHGRAIARAGWSLDGCRQCHGQDLDGGRYEVSCRGCHEQGPEACDTCHRADDRPHLMHLAPGAQFRPAACSDCHDTPTAIDDPGHVEPPVQVRFGEVATARAAAPAFDPVDRRCSDVACHGAGLHAPSAPSPRWGARAGEPDCERCHGMPPQRTAAGIPHPQVRECSWCHAGSAPPGAPWAGGETHGDGHIELRPGVQACDGCHPSPGGAHPAHLSQGPFWDGVGCDACHHTPAAADSPGHIDPAPAEVVLGRLANAGPRAPRWNPDSQTCSDVYCHGIRRAQETPKWDVEDSRGGDDDVSCGDCHGLPPATPGHLAQLGCDSCHPAVVNAAFEIVDPARHVDGNLDFR